MPELTIQDVPQDDLDALTSRAERHGRTLEDEARLILHDAAAEEQLVQQLEQTSRAVDALRAAEQPPAQRAPAPPRRRYGRHEPTPRRT